MDDILIPGQIDATALTSSRRSGRSALVEIITRNARRRWSLPQKREIVAESLGPELTPTEVSRKHVISSGQLYIWRRELLTIQTAMMTRPVPRFAEVEMAAASSRLIGGGNPAPAETEALPSAPSRSDVVIEVVLPVNMSAPLRLRLGARTRTCTGR